MARLLSLLPELGPQALSNAVQALTRPGSKGRTTPKQVAGAAVGRVTQPVQHVFKAQDLARMGSPSWTSALIVVPPPAAATSHRRFFPVRGNFGPSSIPYRSLACAPWLFDQLAPVKESFCNEFCGFPAQWEAKLASEAA